MTIKLLLVDDHQIFLQALQRLLLSVTDLDVVGHASLGAEVLSLARSTSPDVVCMDIHLPDINGIEVTRMLNAALPKIKVVALSGYAQRHYVQDILQAGALGYVTKSESCDELLNAIRSVAKGHTYLSNEVASLMTKDWLDQSAGLYQQSVSAREWQVMQRVADGETSNAIAIELGIAPSTVEVHRRNIMRKLNLHSVAELTRYVDCRAVPGTRDPESKKMLAQVNASKSRSFISPT